MWRAYIALLIVADGVLEVQATSSHVRKLKAKEKKRKEKGRYRCKLMQKSISMITYLVSHNNYKLAIFILMLVFPFCILSRGLAIFPD